VKEVRDDPSLTAQAILQMLVNDAQPFIETFSKTKADLDAVECELEKVALASLHREQLCHELHRKLGVKIDMLRAIGREAETIGRGISFVQVDPWPEAVRGDVLVEGMMNIVRLHIVLGNYGIFTVVLWALLCSFVDSDKIDTLPFLALMSPDMRCGKTRLQTVLEWFVPRPLSTSNISAAAVYRIIEEFHPTLLMDEVDTYAKGDDALRGVLNAGHTRAKAYVIRWNSVTMKPESFNVWCPKCFALIGKLPRTWADRSIIVHMERKKRSEKVKPLRATDLVQREQIMRKIVRWHQDNVDKLEVLDASTTEEISDREADNWLPLLQVAKLLGPKSYANALMAERKLNPSQGEREDQENPTIPLLVRLRRIFQEAKAEKDSILLHVDEEDLLIGTNDLLKVLNADKEAPWADERNGQGLSAKKLANLLAPFNVISVQKKVGNIRPKGYLLSHLQRIFDRYAPPDSEPET
jgi:putative DNA primase/helicase